MRQQQRPQGTGVPEGISRLVSRVASLVDQAAATPRGPWSDSLVRTLRGQWSELHAWFDTDAHRQEFRRRWPSIYERGYQAHWRGDRYVNDFFRRPGAVAPPPRRATMRGLGTDGEGAAPLMQIDQRFIRSLRTPLTRVYASAPVVVEPTFLEQISASVQASPLLWGAGVVAVGGVAFLVVRKIRRGKK